MFRLLGRDFREDDLQRICRKGPFASAEILTSDPKLAWEYGRLQGVCLNALRASPGDAVATARRLAAEIEVWCGSNDDPNGIAWINAMEVAIRVVNVILADAVLRGELSRAMGQDRWRDWLWNHGRCIWNRLESFRISSNHYLANLMGLAYVAAVFHRTDIACRRGRFARQEFEAALLAQTYNDGALYEASLSYHGLVTEMALLCLLLEKDGHSNRMIERIENMVQILADTTDVDGDIFHIGDEDGGRVTGMDFIAGKVGRTGTLLLLAEIVRGRCFAARQQANYPEAGWWVRHIGGWNVFFEYGPVGMLGGGGHAHNDDLSVCVSVDGHRLLVDPGSYIYTADQELRNRFRSTASHSVLMFDGMEQRPIPGGRDGAFRLPERGGATHLIDTKTNSVCAERNYRERAGKQIRYSREVTVDEKDVTITDRVWLTAACRLTWFFHLAPECSAHVMADGVTLKVGANRYLLSCSSDPAITVRCDEYSAMYGSMEASLCLVAEKSLDTSQSVTWNLTRK